MVFNIDRLQEEIDAAGIPNWGVGDGYVTFKDEATQQQRDDAAAIIAAHNPAILTAGQSGRAALRAFLDSHAGDMKYAKYLYELFASVLELWTTKPNLTDRITAVITALKADKENNANDLVMYRVFLDMAQVEYGLTVTNDEIVFSGTVQQQAAQARAALDCARSFMNSGVLMAHMILLRHLI